MSPFRLIACLALTACLFIANGAAADEVVFKSGERVRGTVTREGGRITISGTIFGTVTADESEVESIIVTPTTGRTAGATTAPAGTPASTSPASTAPAALPATIAAAPVVPAPPKPKRWSGSITATAMATRGNSDTDSARVAFDAARKTDGNTLTLGAGYAYGRTTDTTTGEVTTSTDNWFTLARLDHSRGERWYDFAMLRVEADYVANLDVRVTPGVGVGYRWIIKPEEHFNTEGGLSWVYEDYTTGGHEDHFALRLAYHYDRKLNESVSVIHNLAYLPNIVDPSDYNLSADLGLRAMMTRTLFADLKVEWNHDSTPAPGADDNDLRFIVGVGWNF